jgi:hypothetical protein
VCLGVVAEAEPNVPVDLGFVLPVCMSERLDDVVERGLVPGGAVALPVSPTA